MKTGDDVRCRYATWGRDVGSDAPGTGPLSPDFSGISPGPMDRFVKELELAVSLSRTPSWSPGSLVPYDEKNLLGAVAAAVRTKADDEDDRRGIGDLLPAGRLPTEWLADVVATQVFLPGEKTRGETLTPYLEALAADPAAARLAIAPATGNSPLPRDAAARLLTRPGLAPRDRRPDLVTFLRDLNDRAAVDATSADAFGRMLAAASGAYDEKDGAHSDVAARFSFAVVTGTPGFRFAPPTRVHLAEIAGAYATEFAEGANLGDSNQLLPSAFGRVESRVPGLSPAFRLSPEDTYRFLLAFSGDEADRRPFDQGMGDLAKRLVGVNVPAMLRAGDPSLLDDVFAALGNVRGFELAAAEKHLKALDDMAERNDIADDMAWDVSQLVLGKAVPQGELLWLMLDQSRSLLDTVSPGEETNVERLHGRDDAETLGRQHAVAGLLHLRE